MDRGTVICRMLAAQAGVNFGTIKNRRVRGSDLDVVRAAADALGKAPLFIHDTVGELFVSQVRAKPRRYNTRENNGLVVVDHLQPPPPARLPYNL